MGIRSHTRLVFSCATNGRRYEAGLNLKASYHNAIFELTWVISASKSLRFDPLFSWNAISSRGRAPSELAAVMVPSSVKTEQPVYS